MELNNLQLDDCPWLVKAYNELAQPLQLGRAHHAILLQHFVGSGEYLLIDRFIHRLLCTNPINNKPCGNCHSCKLLAANNHPDYYTIEPEEKKISIGVDQIRQISSKVYERSQQGGNKVIWIKVASLMTEAAANALLKTLEEPPANTFFILSDKHNGHLLPTIRSRCQYYFVTVPELDISVNWLKTQSVLNTSTYNDNDLASALLLNQNAPIAALLLLQPEQWQIRVHFYQQLTLHLQQKNFWALQPLFLGSQDLPQTMGWFSGLLSDSLKARQKVGRFILNRDQVPLVRLIASFGVDKNLKMYQLWSDTQQQLASVSGVNQELLISNLLAQSELIV